VSHRQSIVKDVPYLLLLRESNAVVSVLGAQEWALIQERSGSLEPQDEASASVRVENQQFDRMFEIFYKVKQVSFMYTLQAVMRHTDLAKSRKDNSSQVDHSKAQRWLCL
jgi:hypothetical protein